MILAAIYSAICHLQAGLAGHAGERAGNCANYVGNPMARQSGRIAVDDVLQGEFTIVSVGTSSRFAAQDEITEIAALRVGPGLVPGAEFHVLIKPERAVAPMSSRLADTGQSQLNCQGIDLHDAMRQLAAFVNQQPLFTHNEHRDQQLLEQAATQHGLRLDNPFYDSQLVAWSAWPGLPSYQLSQLAEWLGLDYQPAQRALTAVKANLALLRAASA